MEYIDLSLVLAFISYILYKGFLNIRDVTSINSFATGGKSFSVFALSCTIAATWISGSSFFITITNTYNSGLSYFIPSFGIVLCLLLNAIVLAPKMKNYLGSTSIAEAMGNVYGTKIRTITAICGAIGISGSVAIQFKILSELLSYFSNLSSGISLFIVAAVVIFYTAFGGIKSVVKTDIIQLISFFIALPSVITLFIVNVDLSSFFAVTSDDKFNILKCFSFENPDLYSMIALFFYYAIPGIQPTDFQRLSMGITTKQVTYSYCYAALLFFIVKMIMFIIPVGLYSIDTQIEGSLIKYFLDNFTVVIFKGILAIGIIAMAMSTADSMMNIGAVLIANDFWILQKLDKDKKLVYARVFVLLIGLLAIYLALTNNDLLKIILATNSFYVPIVTIPIFCLLFGYKFHRISVYLGMGTAFVFVCFIKFILNSSSNIVTIAMLLNGIVMMISNYIIRNRK